MGKRCLITYTSFTGNTEKVALRFKSTFEKHGWTCDLFKVRKNADDILRPPYDLPKYDFVCAGSGLRVHLPYNEVLNMLRYFRSGKDPRQLLRNRDETIPYIDEPLIETRHTGSNHDVAAFHHKIVLGPDSPKAVVFATYGGYEFGPHEAEPAMMLLALELEHIGFQCIGTFCCPGKFIDDPMPRTFHGDIRERPDATDLMKAEFFIAEKLKEIAQRPV